MRTTFATAILLVLVGVFLAPLAPASTFGTITEFSAGITPNSNPYRIAAGPDGNLWFTETIGNRIGRITPTGTVTEFSTGISPAAIPIGIAAGPDGNLWFTEGEAGAIGRITPTGSVTEFNAGVGFQSGPDGITAGPEGDMWFTELSASRIGRITPTGDVTEFSLGLAPGSGPDEITLGPDGNLWFTEEKTSRIGRITPTGVIAEFSTGISPNSLPRGITSGPDGNIWFTEANGNGLDRIGRITPTGTVTEFSSGITSHGQPIGIAAGPDGNLWFTELSGSRIGRITPKGVVTEFSNGMSSGSEPLGIVAGPDDNMWFVEYQGGSRVGRLALALPPPSIRKLAPRKGPAAGGTAVAVVGNGFTAVRDVLFGTTAASSFTVESTGALTAIAPPGTSGSVDVSVVTANGETEPSAKDHFKYGVPTIESLAPNEGPKSGGTEVTVRGTGFAEGTVTQMLFGKLSASSVNCSSTTACTVGAPPATKNTTVDMRAEVGKLKSKKNASDGFSYR